VPIEFLFRPEFNLVICEHIGAVDDEEFFASYKSLYRDDRFVQSMDHLVDLSRADSSLRSRQSLQSFAIFMKGKLPQTDKKPKIAIIAPKNVSFGLARMYESLADEVPWDFAVFRSSNDALAWLSLPENFMDFTD
jgi:hypothetical protein